MNQRDHDMILKTAFGESDTGESAYVTELLSRDADARKLHDEFASLRLGLRELDDVPACQLSTERMRQAILDQGSLRPTGRRKIMWGYGLAAACLAVGFFVVRSNQAALTTSHVADSTPLVVKTVPAAASSGGPAQALDNKTVVAESVPPSGDTDLTDAVTKGVAVANAPTKRSHSRRSHSEDKDVRQSRPTAPDASLAMTTLGGPDTLSAPPVAPNATASEAGGGGRAAKAALAGSSLHESTTAPEGPIVVVQPVTDPRTGTAVAVEKSNGSDVVFGG